MVTFVETPAPDQPFMNEKLFEIIVPTPELGPDAVVIEISMGGDGVIPPHGGSRGGYHFAFSIASDDVEAWQGRLESEGVAVESVVTWPRGAKSIYFRDPDGNLAELISPGFWSIY